MRRTLITALGVALVGALGVPALADTREDRAAEHRANAKKEINQGQQKAIDEQMKAKQEETGNRSLTSLDKELRDKLGKDWSVRKSGTGYTAVRVVTQKPEGNFNQKMADDMRSFREHHKDATVSNTGSEVMVRGRIDDCNDAAKAIDDFADLKGVDRITVDISCGSNK